MQIFKEFINAIANPKIFFSCFALLFFFVFPINDFFERWNQRLRLKKLWTIPGGLLMFTGLTLFFAIGISDSNFCQVLLKPDNVPIMVLIYLSLFFLWFSMKQATENDLRILKGQPPAEAEDAKEKILVWPDLVFIELIAMIVMMTVLAVWGSFLPAPLEQPANPTDSPNPSKAPWYFLSLQEMLVYYDPWIAGVVLPTLIVFGLMAIPFLDRDERTAGYYCFRNRRMAIPLFLFGWLMLWVFLIVVGTFLRGPNWNFFGPFEAWDPKKLEALTNINLSEFIYMVWLEIGLPKNIFLRELGGFLLVGGYFLVLPPLLAKTLLKSVFERMDLMRYAIFVFLLLTALSLPIKMFLRWIFNLKYLIAIPEYFFNI
jgi:hypothetical protein